MSELSALKKAADSEAGLAVKLTGHAKELEPLTSEVIRTATGLLNQHKARQ